LEPARIGDATGNAISPARSVPQQASRRRLRADDGGEEKKMG